MYRYGGDVDSLDFKFSGEKVGDIYTSFSVGILGLSSETVNALTTWNPAEAMAVSRRIEVYAGYEDGSIANPIFGGIVVEAIPTSPPEMWINMKCINLSGGGSIRNPRSLIDTSLSGILSEIASDMGLSMRWDADMDGSMKVKRFTLQGSHASICEEFSNSFGVTVYEDRGILVACNKRPQMGTPKNPIQIGIDTGMISLPKVSLAGATIKTRLKDDISLMSWIRLNSEIIPKANGLYVVTKKKHTGHFRGDDWYTELETIRMGAKV